MKKVNKILMIVTSILLSLVLISTCIVSGTLAKFVITKDATTVVSLKQVGVKLQIKNGSVIKSDLDASSVTVEYSPMQIYPGFNDKGTALFAFDGTLNVPAILKIRVEVELDDAFYISSDDFTSLSSSYPGDKAYMPVAFRVGTVSSLSSTTLNGSSMVSPWLSNSTNTTDPVGTLETLIESNFYTRFLDQLGMNNQTDRDNYGNIIDKYALKEFSQNDPITFGRSNAAQGTGAVLGPGFGVGIYWEWSLDSSESLIETWLSEELSDVANPIKIKITVSLEQVIS